MTATTGEAEGPADEAGRVAPGGGSPGDRAGLGATLAYALPAVGWAAGLSTVQFFFLKYGTDVLLLSPIAVGLIFFVGRVWDAVSDPIAGILSDATRTRLGRRRPWMLCALPVLCLAIAAVFNPPELSPGKLLAWVTVAVFVYYTAHTAYQIPHQSLGTELSKDHFERNRIFGAMSVAITVGMLAAFVGMQYVTNHATPREAAGRLGAGLAAFMFVVLLIPPVVLRERAEYQGRGGGAGVGALRDILGNRNAPRLLLTQFVQILGAATLGVLAPYYYQYVLGRPDLIAVMPAIFVVSSIVAIPVWIRLSSRYGKAPMWRVALVGAALGFGAVGLVPPGGVIPVGLLMVITGACIGCGTMMGPSLLADVIDSDEHATGERKEGVYSAAWGFVMKSSNACVVLMTAIALQVSGFVPNVDQSETVLWMLRGLVGGLPLVVMTGGALILRGFTIDAAAHARMREEIEARRG
jgi:glycoside/pentoside/hexuronide:cation symporter, GPH family